MRLRVWIVVGGCCFIVLVMGLLEIALVAAGRATVGNTLVFLGIGLVLPSALGLAMWWTVRRWQTEPELRRREPNPRAARWLLVGTVVAGTIAQLARVLTGHGWIGWCVGLLVFVVAWFGVIALARRYDPRLHYFRRTDPLPEGQEEETARDPARGPW